MSMRLSSWALLAFTLSWLSLSAHATAQEEEPSDTASEDGSQNEAADAQPSPAAVDEAGQAEAKVGGGPGARIEAFAGLGFGTRAFQRPTPVGGQRLPTMSFAAVDVGLRAVVAPKERFSVAILLRYQTSLGMRIEERPPFALSNRVDVRSQRAELSAAPTIRLSDADTAAWLSFPIGAEIRTFWPDVHDLMTPGYSLLGPHLRAELIAPLAHQLVLRLGPELQWIVAIDRSLRADGVANQAWAVGGEGSLRLELGATFALDLSYRESHAFASSTPLGLSRPDFSDVERFVTLRLFGGF
jgi:hypothetical protein